MVYVNMCGRHILILNDHKVAADLLDRRANIYSDRPRNIVAGEIMTGGVGFPLMRYGDLYVSSLQIVSITNAIGRWRRMRRASHEALKMTIATKSIQQTESLLLVNDLIKDPENWDEHLRR